MRGRGRRGGRRHGRSHGEGKERAVEQGGRPRAERAPGRPPGPAPAGRVRLVCRRSAPPHGQDRRGRRKRPPCTAGPPGRDRPERREGPVPLGGNAGENHCRTAQSRRCTGEDPSSATRPEKGPGKDTRTAGHRGEPLPHGGAGGCAGHARGVPRNGPRARFGYRALGVRVLPRGTGAARRRASGRASGPRCSGRPGDACGPAGAGAGVSGRWRAPPRPARRGCAPSTAAARS